MLFNLAVSFTETKISENKKIVKLDQVKTRLKRHVSILKKAIVFNLLT